MSKLYHEFLNYDIKTITPRLGGEGLKARGGLSGN